MSERKLTADERAAILDRAQREYDYSGPATSQLVDVEALVTHIAAQDAEIERLRAALAAISRDSCT
jgi:hypothetical protein